MKDVYLISNDEKKELKSISEIILSVTSSFETFTANEFAGEENEDKLDSIDELRNRMKYDIEQLDKANDILISILHDTYDKKLSVQDYTLNN